MQTLKQKFNSLLHRHPWSLQTALASLLALMVVGYVANTTLAAKSDWPWPYSPFNSGSDITDLQVAYSNEFMNDGTILASRSFLGGDAVRVAWKLAQPAAYYNGWKIDFYALKVEDGANQANPKLYPIATNIPATGNNVDLHGNWSFFNWTIPLSLASYQGQPNPYDRHVYAVLRGPDSTTGQMVEKSWNVTHPFNIMLWRITQPHGNTLTSGDRTNVTWQTNLTGRARLYIEVDISGNGSGTSTSNVPIIGELPDIEHSSSVEWQVGYTQSAPGGTWTKLSATLFNKPAHLYLVPLDAGQLPAGYYKGYDYNSSTVDQQPSFTMQPQTAPIISGVDPNHGPLAGGNFVAVSGTGFKGISSLTFDGVPATDLAYNLDGTNIVAKVPAHTTAGAVTVAVSTLDGQNASLPNGYTYDAVAPIERGAIAVLRPTTDEVLTDGQTYTIQWKFTTLPDASYASGQAFYYLVDVNIAAGNDSPIGSEPINVDLSHPDKVYEYDWPININGSIALPDQFTVKVKYFPNVVPSFAVEAIGGIFTLNPAAQFATPVIDSIAPSQGQVGSSFTLTGHNFGDTHDANSDVVWFSTGSGVGEATVTSWTDGEIVATVPGFAEVGPHQVTVVLGLGSNGGNRQSRPIDFLVTQASTAFSATYYSKVFDVSNADGVGPTALGAVTAAWHESQTAGAHVTFAVGFFRAYATNGGPLVWAPIFNENTPGMPLNTFDSEGYFTIPKDGLASGYDMGWLNGKLSEAEGIRIRIFMETANINDTNLDNQPSVQSVSLDYTVADTTDIGAIEFADPAGSDGTVTKTIAPGSQGSFDITVRSINHFVGQVVIRISAITQVGGNGDDVTGQILATDVPLTLDIPDVPDGTAVVPATIHFTVANDPSMNGTYQFILSGYNTANQSETLRPTYPAGRINVSGEATSFTLAITPGTRSVIRGQSATYNLALTRNAGFTGAITLSNNVATIFGNGVTASFSNSTLSGADTSSVLTIATTNSAALTDAKIFTINGSSPDQPDAIATAQLAIVDAANAVTLNLTIPVEGGLPADLTKPNPRFTVNIYRGLSIQDEYTDLTSDAQNKVVIIATREELPNGTYTIYARSTRHLWGKSIIPATLVIDDTHNSYDVTFPLLKTGNLTVDNKINTLDLPPANEYGVLNLWSLGDLNNDGKINIMDLTYIMQFNYSLMGDQLPQ